MKSFLPFKLKPMLKASMNSNLLYNLYDFFLEFNPANLFKNNENGFFYDANDLSTMFADTAGTTPITGAGQSVALQLDKPLGLLMSCLLTP